MKTLLLTSVFGLLLALSEPSVAAGDAATQTSPHAQAALNPENRAVKVRLTIDGVAMTASLNGSAAAHDFLAMLPLTLTLEDYASTEKIAYLPRKLSTAGAPAGHTPTAGDIAYYAPWGNLAIFHKDFRYSEGLVSLGRVESGAEALKVKGARTALVERVEK